MSSSNNITNYESSQFSRHIDWKGASNVGYLLSFIPVLVGYYLLRKYHPEYARPFRLPEWFKYVALLMAVILGVIWIWGGPLWSWKYYGLGWLIMLSYIPFYLYRTRFEDGLVEAAINDAAAKVAQESTVTQAS
ncbi:MAG: hypothetical protein ACYC21_06430 [Eubacteriales bacterium]